MVFVSAQNKGHLLGELLTAGLTFMDDEWWRLDGRVRGSLGRHLVDYSMHIFPQIVYYGQIFTSSSVLLSLFT